MFSNDFGQDFNSSGNGGMGGSSVSKPPPPVNDIFSQAASGFPTIGTFNMDAPNGGGGGGFNKDRNQQHMKKGDSDNMMFGEIGTFGQTTNSSSDQPNAGTQETGIIEKLLVSGESLNLLSEEF